MLSRRPTQLVARLLLLWLLAFGAAAEPLSLNQVVEEARDGVYNRFWLDGMEAEEGFSLDQLARSQWFALQLDHPQADDGLVAAGAALALNKPSAYLVMGREQLPYFLRQADKVRPGQVLIPGPSEHDVSFQTQPAPLATLDKPVDSFIGSLMSNLNNFEYGEARLHLGAIRDALISAGGRKYPYCEALNVARPSDFDSPAKALAQDLAALQKAETCIFYLYDGKSRPSGVWVEVGAALAWNKPSVLLTPSLEALPPALRLPQRNLRVVVYQTRQHLLHQLQGDDARSLVVP
ncbi:MAG: hypothetical protein J0I12_24450 [Candidatus Eremiobacteraeota bacterium]|nr:hypothetical protein [Candidatus Eremiobacteraeota bacterium]